MGDGYDESDEQEEDGRDLVGTPEVGSESEALISIFLENNNLVIPLIVYTFLIPITSVSSRVVLSHWPPSINHRQRQLQFFCFLPAVQSFKDDVLFFVQFQSSTMKASCCAGYSLIISDMSPCRSSNQ